MILVQKMLYSLDMSDIALNGQTGGLLTVHQECKLLGAIY
jgi:hypothetical protein